MTPMDRYIAAADALAEALEMVGGKLKSGDDRPDDTWADFDGAETEIIFNRATEYRAAREAITAAGVNDMNEGKEG